MFEALSQVQAPQEELDQLSSLASVQTKGLKRHFNDDDDINTNIDILSFSTPEPEVMFFWIFINYLLEGTFFFSSTFVTILIFAFSRRLK